MIVAAALAFVVSLALVALLARPGLGILDEPGARSLHDTPTPRGGGLGILAGILAGELALGLFAPGLALVETPVIVAASVLAGVSLLDDLYDLSPALRLPVHLGAAAVLVVSVYPDVGMARTVLGALAITWMVNLYNFMDGMDGLAAGMGAIGFGALALFGWLGGEPAFAAALTLVAAACLGFLRFNFPPARIFLGDVGSCTLGYIAAWAIARGAREAVVPLWAGVAIFAPFVVDATWTLARRALAGERVWEAHRGHLYQRAVRSGLPQRRVVLGEYGLMGLCAAAMLVATRTDGALRAAAVALLVLALGTAVAWASRRPLC